MTKAEIALLFEVGFENQVDLDKTLREKVFQCTEEVYERLCEQMEDLGYFGIRLYPFCAKADDDEGLKKALRWIAENSELLKNINQEHNPGIQLSVKFLVGDSWADTLGVFTGYPLQLAFSPDDLELLKDNKIELKVTANYTNSIDD